jgi:hypothetical protein
MLRQQRDRFWAALIGSCFLILGDRCGYAGGSKKSPRIEGTDFLAHFKE